MFWGLFCTSKSSTSFPSWYIENQGKITQKLEYFSFFEVFFDHTCILKLRMIKEANLMLLKLSFENQQHCDPLTPQTLDKFISEREIFAFFVNAAESGKGGVHHLS